MGTCCHLIASIVLLHLNLIRLRFLVFQIVWASCSLRLMRRLLLGLPLLLVLNLLHLHLLLLSGIDSLRMVRVIRVEIVPRCYLFWYRHRTGRKDLFLLHGLLLLLLEQLLFFHALPSSLDLAKAPTDIFKLKVRACDRTRVFLVWFFFSVDAFVVCEVNIVYIFLFCFRCHCLVIICW